MSLHLSIIVDRGSPLDYQAYRHTKLWFQCSDGSMPVVVHITGTQGLYDFEIREEANPGESKEFAREIDVGVLESCTSLIHIQHLLASVPVDNRSREFNCQTWIERALRMLTDLRFLSARQYEQGLDGMIDAIAEAEDEEI